MFCRELFYIVLKCNKMNDSKHPNASQLENDLMLSPGQADTLNLPSLIHDEANSVLPPGEADENETNDNKGEGNDDDSDMDLSIGNFDEMFDDANLAGDIDHNSGTNISQPRLENS